MELTPFIFLCLGPLVWTALVFWAGRISARYRIHFEPRDQPQAATPYTPADPYANFGGER